MEEKFDFEELKKASKNDRYSEIISNLREINWDVDGIEKTINHSMANINSGVKSFVICGDPQSGKTGMMIALTAKLLDNNHKLIIHLITDNVSLLEQNLKRFSDSGLDPSPKNFDSILNENIDPKNNELVIFCKKNSSNLKKLIEKLKDIPDKVIIDDEADSATPNSKIRRGEESAIYRLTGELMDQKKGGYWIAVTATPSRIDLNNTHNNLNDHWVYFPSHPNYNGPDTFFPLDKEKLDYELHFISGEEEDYKKDLEEALFRFLVNVSYINLFEEDKKGNYSFLIHTSGKTKDHDIDENTILKIINALRNKEHAQSESYYKKIFDFAESRYPKKGREIVNFISKNIGRNEIIVINNTKAKKSGDVGAKPHSLFTIIIGGNIISRGVTFDNLLSMFFTRNVKGKYQQDTYIQRARMFGTRNKYLKYFELTIPKELYLNWHDCFFYHRLCMEYIKSGMPPSWAYGGNVIPTGISSVDKENVKESSGEMGFSVNSYETENEFRQLWDSKNPLKSLEDMRSKFGNEVIPDMVLNYIKSTLKDPLIKLYNPTFPKMKDFDPDKLERKRRIMRKGDDFGNFDHHFGLIFNPHKKIFRVIYKPAIRRLGFLKNLKKHD
jgi:hypothetical protein